MNTKELLQSALFFDKVKDVVGKEAFERNRDVIVETTAAVMDTWRENGKDTEDLFQTDELLTLVDAVCAAQDAMDTLVQEAITKAGR